MLSKFSQFKRDIYNDSFKGILAYMPGKDNLLQIFEKVILEMDVVKKIKGLNLTVVKDLFNVIDAFTNLNFDKLMDYLVFTDGEVLSAQVAAS